MFDVYAQRKARTLGVGACAAQSAQTGGYADARWNARLALAFLPASVLLFVGAARSARTRGAALAVTVAPFALIAWNVVLLRETSPGDVVLFSGVCRLWDVRDEVRSEDPVARNKGCFDLRNILDPKRYEYEREPALLARALPDLAALRKRCLDDVLADVERDVNSGTWSVAELLDDPLVGPEQREGFAKSLNAMDRNIRDVRCLTEISLCVGSRLPSDIPGTDDETAIRVRASMRWAVRHVVDCVAQRAFYHDGVFHFTVVGTIATGGALASPSLVDIDGIDDRNARKLIACASEVFPSLPVLSGVASPFSLLYPFWGGAPGVDGAR